MRIPEKKDGGRGWLSAAALIAFWFGTPAHVRAQELWRLGEVTRGQERPAVTMNGVAVRPGPDGPVVAAPPRVSAEVQVTYDYLRLGFGFLRLPLPDGSVIEAENAVFEDRGGGNLMWTGEVPGAGYESVLFTVQDGHLVGWFGKPGGSKYVVHAGPDGRGTLAEEAGPAGDWCGVGSGREGAPGRSGWPAPAGGPAARGTGPTSSPSRVAAADPPRPVASEANGGALDILLLYNEGAERYWRAVGGPSVGVRQLGDYLNMAFRNGALRATANLIPVRWDPGLHNHPSVQGGHFQDWSLIASPWHFEFETSPEVARLRERYAPDLVHFVPMVSADPVAGFGHVRSSLDPQVLTGWSSLRGQLHPPGLFAHEIGHNLGGEHEPAAIGDGFVEYQSEAFRPYVFGHTDMTSCARREGHGDDLMCPATIMSYGTETGAVGDSWTEPAREPFYSSVRHKPNGWTIGIAGTSEVERVFRETVPVAATSGGQAPRREQFPRKIDARWVGRDAVRITWPTAFEPYSTGQVRLAAMAGGDDVLIWNFDTDSEPPVLDDEEWLASNVTPLLGNDGSVVGVEVSGLAPGGGYRVAVKGPWRWTGDEFIRSLPSDVFYLEPPRPAAGAPAAPTNLGAVATGPDSVRLTWRDNSNDESGFEIWYRKWSWYPDESWRRHGRRASAGARSVEMTGLLAEEEIRVTDYGTDPRSVWTPPVTVMRGRYSFAVVAYNDSGYSASEAFHFEFMPGADPASTAPGEFPDCNPERETGLDLDGFEVYACLETPDGERRRAWDYRLDADQSGLLYFFERDNVEILVKVLDGCAVNGHRWVFVAPVTDLAFRLRIGEPGPRAAGYSRFYAEDRGRWWHYDSNRRPQERIRDERAGNPKGRTARTVSDTTAFPCTAAEVAAAKAKAADAGGGAPGAGPPPASTFAASANRLAAGTTTDCVPSGPALALSGGYTVSMCYETSDGAVGQARDWGLDSSQSALLYFFERNNVEVLIKVLDGCGVNGHRWVFVAPVTDLAFNLHVEGPGGDRWTHRNRLGRVADTRSDVEAFGC